MDQASLIFRYFDHLTAQQQEQFAALRPLYETWNAQINVISRKDMEAFYLHHVLHSLALVRTEAFSRLSIRDQEAPGTVLDVGTGGGFPGIPLAIMFPQIHFTLCDSIAKKTKVVQAVVQELDLHHVTVHTGRAEELQGESYNIVVSRAVAPLSDFIPWVWKLLRPHGTLLCLKGGSLIEEMDQAARVCHLNKRLFGVRDIAPMFPDVEDDFFITKKICEIQQT